MLLVAATLVATAATTVAWFALRRGRRLRLELAEARARLALYDAELPETADHRSVSASALRRDQQKRFVARETEHYRELLAQLLADFRDATGAEEAVYWQFNAAGDALIPVDWSTEGQGPAYFDHEEWGPLVFWAAEADVVQTVGPGDSVVVGAACVKQGETQLGVLSLTNRQGLTHRRDALKAWLPRLATQLAYFQELVQRRLEYGRHMRQSQALLDAVQRLQAHSGGEGLAQSVCETALEVSGARAAVLIRWSPDAETGEVHFATPAAGLPNQSPLGGSSMVAEACRAARVHVLEDARGIASGEALYGIPRGIREPGAVAIMPLVKDQRVLGAVVLEAEAAGALRLDDVRPLSVLGAVVAASLELAWSYQDIDRKARTDALTGLYNRLHFGEELERALDEADRHERPVSLVLVDIDHFKRVNDTWGHEAGDAVLKHVARILKEGSRSVDSCFRYGGEEIAMVMADTGSARAVEVAERLRARLEAVVVRHGGAEIAVTASFGVATYPEGVKVRDQLFPAADKALYVAKHDGRNCVRSKPLSRGKASG